MIKTRLIGLLSHAKKYIVFQVVWKWQSLLCQIGMIYAVSMFLEQALEGALTERQILSYGIMVLMAMLLAIIRHKVFAALRKLCPARLEGRDKGNLISIITSDIELLEVFYAHTISPIAIAALTSLIMVVFIGFQYVPAGAIALAGYLIVGAAIPLWNGKKERQRGWLFAILLEN